jgi:hypothetical protein
MKRMIAIAMVTLACGASSVTIDAPQTLPNAGSGTGTSAAITGDPRSCDHLGPIVTRPRDQAALPVPTAVVAGQMTEQAARAKRLFDGERWAEAERALEPVARGQSGDDVGNAQLAQYHLAIVIYREKDFRRSYAIFSEMARNRSHIKHMETLLWLAKFVVDYAGLVDFADFATYDREDVARFDNPNQRDIYSVASFALGRERLQEGAREEAIAFFARVNRNGPFGELAAQCTQRAR